MVDDNVNLIFSAQLGKVLFYSLSATTIVAHVQPSTSFVDIRCRRELTIGSGDSA
jgi:hypothetical protein